MAPSHSQLKVWDDKASACRPRSRVLQKTRSPPSSATSPWRSMPIPRPQQGLKLDKTGAFRVRSQDLICCTTKWVQHKAKLQQHRTRPRVQGPQGIKNLFCCCLRWQVLSVLGLALPHRQEKSKVEKGGVLTRPSPRAQRQSRLSHQCWQAQ